MDDKIPEISLHPSVNLVWVIADFEAAISNCDLLTLAYVMLGVLKVLDNNYNRVTEAIKFSADELQQVSEMAASCRPLLQLSERELTAARRCLHKTLHEHDGEIPLHVQRLPWSGDAIYLHKRSIRRAMDSGVQTVTLEHLLIELLASLPLEAAPFFKNHPPAQLETD